MPAPENTEPSPDELAFVVAAAEGRAGEVQRLLAQGVPVDVRDIENHRLGFVRQTTALMHAAYGGHLEVTKILLQAGAKVSAKSTARKQDGGGGSQALHFAVRGGNQAVVEALVDAGADLNIVGDGGRSPLTLAIVLGNFDLIQLLLQKGADIKLKPRKGDYTPPLVVAISAKIPPAQKQTTFQLLMAAGADPNAVGALNESALTKLAIFRDIPEQLCVALLRDLLKAGAAVNHVDRDGFNALESAVLRHRPMVVQLLLESGADANHVTPQRGTSLDIATKDLALTQSALTQPPVPTGSEREELAGKTRQIQAVIDLLRQFGARRQSELPAETPAEPAASKKPAVK